MFRTANSWFCFVLLTMLSVVVGVRAAPLSWLSPELRRIEAQRQALQHTLATLPSAPVPHHTERRGFHSGYSSSPDTVEWVELDLRREATLDAVVLVPAAADSGAALPGHGFPARFRVEISSSAGHADRVVIADQTHDDFANPGALPVFLPCAGRRARFVRITATRLFREGDRALFALGEVMVLQGPRNIAAGLRRSDFTCSRTTGALPVWGLANLVDGHTLLGPPEGGQRSPSLGYRSREVDAAWDPHPQPRWVHVDLGATMPVDEVRLFPAHPPEFAHRRGYGYPSGLKVELAEADDFRHPIELASYYDGSAVVPRDPVGPGDNAITYIARNETARFVRVTAPHLFDANARYVFALAELQVWSGDANVALGKPVGAYDSTEGEGWSRAALVDGFTSRANILDWPGWLQGLSQRRETMQRIAALDAQHVVLISRLQSIGWWLLGAMVAAALLMLIGSNLRQRRARLLELETLRQGISQDLHDEIGSSLGSIAFISQDAIACTRDPDLLRELGEIRDTAEQTLDSMRDIVRLVQKGNYGHGDLTEHLREIAGRMLRGIPHALHDEAAVAFNRLPMHQRRDLVLIFKEALHNLVRHAQASRADILLAQSDDTLIFTVRDNGRGFDPAALNGSGIGLTNLQRRAAKHGGSIHIASAPTQGTTLTLTLPRHA